MNQLEKNIATNLKRIRKSRNMSLDMMAERTGVSKSMLGQIERGESNPTVATIGKIVEGIRISFDDLISTPPESVELVEKKDILVYDKEGCQIYGYKTYEAQRDIEIYEIRIMPGKKYEAASHGDNSHEFVIVNQGSLKVVTGKEEYLVNKGNAIDFITDKTHTFFNETEEELVLEVVFYLEDQRGNLRKSKRRSLS